jgi:hypothetical protein
MTMRNGSDTAMHVFAALGLIWLGSAACSTDEGLVTQLRAGAGAGRADIRHVQQDMTIAAGAGGGQVSAGGLDSVSATASSTSGGWKPWLRYVPPQTSSTSGEGPSSGAETAATTGAGETVTVSGAGGNGTTASGTGGTGGTMNQGGGGCAD